MTNDLTEYMTVLFSEVELFTHWSVWVIQQWLRLHTVSQADKHLSENNQVSTCVGKRSRASDTLWRAGRPFPFPKSPFTMTPPPPPPPSESDEGESWPEVSVSISLTHGGLRSMWKSAEILQLLETSKRARLMKNGSTWGSAERWDTVSSHLNTAARLYNIPGFI